MYFENDSLAIIQSNKFGQTNDSVLQIGYNLICCCTRTQFAAWTKSDVFFLQMMSKSLFDARSV